MYKLGDVYMSFLALRFYDNNLNLELLKIKKIILYVVKKRAA